MESRYRVESFGDSLRVTVPSRKIWHEYSKGNLVAFTIIGGFIVIVALVITIIFVPAYVRAALAGATLTGWNCFAVGFALWVFFFPAWLLYAIYFFLRMATGSETIQATHDALEITRKAFGISYISSYSTAKMQRLQVYPVRGTFHERNFVTFGITPGTLGFEYQNKTVRFGTSLDDDEAAQIVNLIVAQFPNYSYA